jgi:hypothetical protein
MVLKKMAPMDIIKIIKDKDGKLWYDIHGVLQEVLPYETV